MDISETYIKMCEKATEIQEVWEKYWDRCSFSYPLNAMSKSRFTWCPRQDQLQEMIQPKLPISEMSKELAAFCKEEMYKSLKLVSYSWEGLWLALIMKVKYFKIWDGEDWVKGA